MRKHIRSNRSKVIFVLILVLLPLCHLWNTIESRKAMAAFDDFIQVVELDVKSSNSTSQSSSNVVSETDNTSDINKTYTFVVDIQPDDSEETSIPSEETIVIEPAEVDTDDSSESSNDNMSTILEDMEALGGEEQYWALARIASAEAGSATELCKLAVISTILNRVKCHLFPDTIYDVVMQDDQFFDGWPNFTDSEGNYRTLEREDVPDSIKEAIHTVITEGDFSNHAYFYIAPKYLPQRVIDRFYELYGTPCLILENGEGIFFTVDCGKGC